MSARRNPHIAPLPINVELIKAVRNAATKRAARDAGWDTVRTEWSDQAIQQVVGNSTTARGAIWQVAQAVKELNVHGRAHFVIHGRQADSAVQVTVAAAEAEVMACRAILAPIQGRTGQPQLALVAGPQGRKQMAARRRRAAKRQAA